MQRVVGLTAVSLAAAMFAVLAAVWGLDAHEAEARDGGADSRKISGVLNVVYVDPKPGSETEPRVDVSLAEPGGGTTELKVNEDVESPATLDELAGERVEVEGEKAPDGEFRAETIEPARSGPLASEVSGSKPTITLLCRFGDSTGTTPEPASHFEGLMGGAYPGLDHYWREVSYGQVNLNGSRVAGWYNLPRNAAAYKDSAGNLDHDLLVRDCTARADADVDFRNYTNINVMYNEAIVGYALGGRSLLNLDGQQKTFGVTWMPPWGYEQNVLAHEMGHTFGLPHSSGLYDSEYDSGWDVMSFGSYRCEFWLREAHPDYGCPGTHTISPYKESRGWIPENRIYTADSDSTETITLERLAQPGAGGHLMAKALGSDGRLYTVEARKSTGYDVDVPAEAVVIHEVEPDAGGFSAPRAYVVDPDDNGNPNDDAARWLPGETFQENGVSIQILSDTGSGYQVRITAPVTALPETFMESSGPAQRSHTRSRAATLEFYSLDWRSSFECKLDGAGFSPCYSPMLYFNLSQGTHTFQVRALNGAGSPDPTPTARSWTVDFTKPTIAAPSPLRPTRAKTPKITAAIRDNLTALGKPNVKLYVNNKPASKWSFANGKLTYKSPRLTPGRKTVKIVAVDRAGNIATRQWTFKVLK